MGSRFLMCTAAVLVVVAIVLGYWGIRIAQQPAAVSAEEPHPPGDTSVVVAPDAAVEEVSPSGVDVVVVAQDVSAHQRLERDHLQVERLGLMPPGGFSDPERLLGRAIGRDTPRGTVLKESHFASGGVLAHMIRPDERAIAVPFNSIMGAGGHVAPGDYVDVLLFLPQTEQNADRTMQVAVPALRVLTVGHEMGLTLQGDSLEPLSDQAGGLFNGAAPPPPETLVLAVPEALLTRLALAADVGELRIAVRAFEEQRLAEFYRGGDATEALNERLFQFEQLALRPPQPPEVNVASEPASPRYSPVATERAPEPPTASVAVIRGAARSLEAP